MVRKLPPPKRIGTESMLLAGHRRSAAESGFSMLELVVVAAISTVLTCVGIVSYSQITRDAQISSAYNETLSALRRAHDSAVAERRVYAVTISNTVLPNTVTVSKNDIVSSGGILLSKVPLPTGVTFLIQTGMPTLAPDSLGLETYPIDYPALSGLNNIYFYPDGSVRNAATAGAIKSGVVYLGRSGNISTERAITIWGTTGRLRGWRANKSGSSSVWTSL